MIKQRFKQRLMATAYLALITSLAMPASVLAQATSADQGTYTCHCVCSCCNSANGSSASSEQTADVTTTTVTENQTTEEPSFDKESAPTTTAETPAIPPEPAAVQSSDDLSVINDNIPAAVESASSNNEPVINDTATTENNDATTSPATTADNTATTVDAVIAIAATSIDDPDPATVAATAEQTEQQSPVAPEVLITFSELLPNPVGDDAQGEFIELANNNAVPVEMSGWVIKDSKGRQFALPAGPIAAGGKIALPYSQTKIPQPNTGGAFELYKPDGALSDSVQYGSDVKEGWAFAKFGEEWFWTDVPTPGTDNVIPATSANASAGASTSVNANTSASTNTSTSADTAATSTQQSSTSTSSSTVAADTATSTSTTTATTSTTQSTSTTVVVASPIPHVVISEFMPDPVGDDAAEWIELTNLDDSTAVLNGWTLDDAEGGSSPYRIPDGTTIPARGVILFGRDITKLALNNTGDSVRLFGPPNGALLQEVIYTSSKEGEALAYIDNEWTRITSPTPSTLNPSAAITAATTASTDANTVTAQLAVASTQEAAAQQTVADPPLSVEQTHDVTDGSAVTVTGVVTVPLGVLGKTIFGLRDADTDYGATVRIYSGTLPSLKIGDVVTVAGTVQQKDSGEIRINTSGSDPITLTGRATDIVAPEIRLSELDGSGAGLAVTINGTVTDTGSNWFVLADSKAEHEIKIELPSDTPVAIKTGDMVSVRGVVRVERSVVALAVLGGEDVTDTTTQLASTAQVATTTTASNQNQNGGGTTGGAIPFLVIGALGAGGVAYRGLKSKRGTENKAQDKK